jgi:hypothetical protein
MGRTLMSSNIEINFGIPTYNGDKHIIESIESVLCRLKKCFKVDLRMLMIIKNNM